MPCCRKTNLYFNKSEKCFFGKKLVIAGLACDDKRKSAFNNASLCFKPPNFKRLNPSLLSLFQSGDFLLRIKKGDSCV